MERNYWPNEPQLEQKTQSYTVSQDWAKWLTVDDGRTVHEVRSEDHEADIKAKQKMHRSRSEGQDRDLVTRQSSPRVRAVTFSNEVKVRQIPKKTKSQEKKQRNRFRKSLPLPSFKFFKRNNESKAVPQIGPKTMSLLFAVGSQEPGLSY
mmetsp:Transcript_9442/g.10763  ORF Transcript_9442/g.10763 Transcript_9442/m.10763 type:complete len:150 (+) Transcript_9442:356-805(+)